MANYASISCVINRTPSPSFDDPFELIVGISSGSFLMASVPVDTRENPGEFSTFNQTPYQVAIRLRTALGADYISPGEIAVLPLEITQDGNTLTFTATEYGVSFTEPFSRADWYSLTNNIPENPPAPVGLLGTITAEEGSYPCSAARYNIAFDNAIYPVTLEGPAHKTFNNASEAWWEYARGYFPPLTIKCTDAEGKVFEKLHPSVDEWTITEPSIVEQSPGFTITAEYNLDYKGEFRANLLFKIDDGQWRAQSIFYNVPIGNHTIYIKDDYGCEQSIDFQCGEIEETKIYLADKGQRCDRVAHINNPVNTPERINMIVVFPTLGKEEKLQQIPTEVEPGVYVATFDLNNVLSGYLEDILFNVERFTFPCNPGDNIIDRTSLLLEFYCDESYTFTDTDGTQTESGRTDNSELPHHYALNGGVSDEMRGYLADKELTFDQWLKDETTLKWLTNMPNELPVHPTQPLRLWFLNNNAMSNMSLKVQARFTDGSISGIIDKELESLAFGLFELCVGAAELQLSGIDIQKTVDSYDVWLTGLQGALPVNTSKQSYVIDYSYYERNDILLCPTSLGVTEVLWCNGRASEQADIDIETSLRPLSQPRLDRGTIRGKRDNYTHAFKMNTGYFPKSMRHYMIDLLSGGHAVLPVDYFLRPVIINPGKMDLGKDDEDLWATDFDMTIAHNNHHYTKLPEEPSPWGQFSDTFNESFFI